jgi:hypothetical protein
MPLFDALVQPLFAHPYVARGEAVLWGLGSVRMTLNRVNVLPALLHFVAGRAARQQNLRATPSSVSVRC